MGALDELLSGAGTVAKTALQVPQAVGGGALDILIGDRQNVPVGEQVKRSVEALLLAGDNPANLIAIHGMNARRDAQNQAVVGSPEFQNFMEQAQARGATPMESFDAAAKVYGVHGFAPDTQQQAVDLAPGGPSAPERQTVPILPPPDPTAVAKNIEAHTKLGAYTMGSPEDQAAARFEGAKVAPPLWFQQDRGRQAIGEQTPGAGTTDITWNGSKLGMAYHELKPDEKAFNDPVQGLDAVHFFNLGSENAGSSKRAQLLKAPDGTFSLKLIDSEEAKSKSGVRGKALGEQTPLASPDIVPSAQGRTPAELKQDAANAAQTSKETLKLVSTQLAESAKAMNDADFITGQLRPLRELIPSLPDKTFKGATGAAASVYRKVTNYLGTNLELESAQVPIALKSTASLIVANIGRRFGEKGVFTDRDLKRFMDVLDVSNSSQQSAGVKLGQVESLGAELAQRAADKAAGRPVMLEKGATYLTPEQINVRMQAALAPAGTTRQAPAPTAAPSNVIKTESGRTILYKP